MMFFQQKMGFPGGQGIGLPPPPPPPSQAPVIEPDLSGQDLDQIALPPSRCRVHNHFVTVTYGYN
jgi:hypothetical protein